MPKGVPKNRVVEAKPLDAIKEHQIPDDGHTLTDKQERFAFLMGWPDKRGQARRYKDAYLQAGYDWKGGDPGPGLDSSLRNTALQLTKKPHVAARIAHYRAQYLEELRESCQSGLAVQEVRIQHMQHRHNLINDLLEARQGGLKIIAERVVQLEAEIVACTVAATKKTLRAKLDDLLSQFVAGEETGLLAKDVKAVGFDRVTVGRFDKALLDAALDIEERIGRELGQITTKADVTSGGKPIESLTDAERLTRLAQIIERARSRASDGGGEG